jgi:hypothetical protein
VDLKTRNRYQVGGRSNNVFGIEIHGGVIGKPIDPVNKNFRPGVKKRPSAIVSAVHTWGWAVDNLLQ